jgi:hypothetical protein
VGGLSHYIERQGVPTTGISLIREHSERIRPPRALWVPFPLGRPFGPPNQPEFQLDVLRRALRLLERERGPVLEDYPFESPEPGEIEGEGWSCPLPLPPIPEASSPAEAILQSLRLETSLLRPWFDEARSRRGRTAFGLSGLTPDDIEPALGFVAALAAGESVEPPAGVSEPMPAAIRYVADDLKAFYLEAAYAQPAAAGPSVAALNGWLYGQTHLGRALYDIRDRLASSEEPRVRGTPLIPVAFRQRPA